MRPTAPLDQVLGALTCRAAVLVGCYEEDPWWTEEEHGVRPEDCEVIGLLTIADLTKHGLRNHLYPILADLEYQLGQLLHSCVLEDWTWVRHLNEDMKARVLGNLALARQNDVEPDTGAVAFATLGDLLMAIEKTPEVSSAMGPEFRRVCGTARHAIGEIRNRVMHVVRPLVNCQKDVGELLRGVTTTLDLTRKVALRSR